MSTNGYSLVDSIMDQFLEITDILNLFEKEVMLGESVFENLVLRRPKLIIRTLKQFTGDSITRVTVSHVFLNEIHNFQFQLKINLLMKLIQSMSHFNGSLSQAKELTDLLIRFGCDFTLDPCKYEQFTKLFFHNIAQNLCSIDNRIEWQFQYIWFLAKKPGFHKLIFKELPDYWSGEALHRLKRINPSADTTEDKCRKFVIILLISGNFPDFETKLRPNSLELLDRHSLKLLLRFGFDFNNCLKAYHKISEDIEETDDKLKAQNPKLMTFLSEVEYFRKPQTLKDQVCIHFMRREGRHLNKFSKKLYTNGLIPEHLSDYLRYRHFVQY